MVERYSKKKGLGVRNPMNGRKLGKGLTKWTKWTKVENESAGLAGKGLATQGKSDTEKQYIWGKPMEGKKPLEKSRMANVYGCGWMWSKRCARWVGRSGRAKIGMLEPEVVSGMEAALAGRGPSRKRKETLARQREGMLRTVRSWKMKRGVPVRGQRTSTNGKTARRLNGKR